MGSSAPPLKEEHEDKKRAKTKLKSERGDKNGGTALSKHFFPDYSRMLLKSIQQTL